MYVISTRSPEICRKMTQEEDNPASSEICRKMTQDGTHQGGQLMCRLIQYFLFKEVHEDSSNDVLA